MKKYLLLFALLLLTGCSATYNLDIDSGNFTEKLDIDGASVNSISDLILPLDYDIDEYTIDDVKPGDEGFYGAKIKDNGYSLFHTFKYDDYVNSTILNSCYDKVDAKFNDDDFYISTVGKFSCFESYDDLDNVTIKIRSQYKLVSTNADKVDGFNYIWNISRNDTDKGIYIELDTTNRKKSIMDFIRDNNVMVFIIQFVLISLLVLIILFIKRQNDKDVL